MKKTISCVDQTLCTGCGACYNKCPVNAINMKANKEGFLYPVIDSEKCIDCGLCYKVCPIEESVSKNQDPNVYAVWCDYETRMKSSSGGFFSVLANYVLDNGGWVCGARYNDTYDRVYHDWICKKEDLQLLRGSKYVQSDTGLTYRFAKRQLDAGNWVLYSGCACQVAGLIKYLGKDYEKLILVDIICHGAPSPEVYRSYINEIANGRKIEKMDFREKAHWGWGTATSLFMENGEVHRNDCFKDPYWVSFLSALSTRKCCDKCPYTEVYRVSDFTLGDFWGVKAINEKLDDSKGTSLVLVNTNKAKILFESLKNKCDLAEKVDLHAVLEVAKTRNGQLLHPQKTNFRRERFFSEFERTNHNFINSYRKATLYDIGYVGWWDSMNYGSALTSFAMNRTLKNLGKTVIMLEHRGMVPGKEDYGLDFAKHFYDCSKITNTKDFKRFNSVCDTFLVGSDQVWNWWNIQNDPGFFFLDFVDNNHKKIAYASSFGMDDTDFPDDKRIRVSYLLSKFNAISVREKSGVDVCRDEFGVKATHVLDPVFLCDMASYDEVTNLSKCKDEKDYVFSYILDPTEDKIEMVRTVAAKLGMNYKIAVDALNNYDSHTKSFTQKLMEEDNNVLTNLRIEDWLKYIKNSSYVATDSFHGLCYSIIYNKNVIAYINPRRGSARFESIAQTTGLENRLITDSSQIAERKLLNRPINYKVVNSKLNAERERSMNWLKAALDAKLKKPSEKELLLWKCIEHDHIIYSNHINKLQETIDALQKRIEALEEKKATE